MKYRTKNIIVFSLLTLSLSFFDSFITLNASNNQNKFVEVKKLIKNFNLISNSDLNIEEEIPETENTIKGNSFLKSNYVHKKFGLSCFADDSGLFIKALNGDPGIKSARYASDKSDSDLNIDLVLKNLERETNRDAFFETYIYSLLNRIFIYIFDTILSLSKYKKTY